jgi:hypothetical protein
LSYMTFIIWRYIPSILSFLRVFIMKGCQRKNFVKGIFCIYWDVFFCLWFCLCAILCLLICKCWAILALLE